MSSIMKKYTIKNNIAVLKNTVTVTDEELEIYKKEMMPYIAALANNPPTELLNMPFTKD